MKSSAMGLADVIEQAGADVVGVQGPSGTHGGWQGSSAGARVGSHVITRFPVVLTRDYNRASQLDWTRSVSSTRPEVPNPFGWPVSRHWQGQAGDRDGEVIVPTARLAPGRYDATPRSANGRTCR